MKRRSWSNVLSSFFIIVLFMTMVPMIALAEQQNDSALNEPITGFEERGGEDWTTYEEELDFLEEVAESSDRVTYSQIGTTEEGRALHLVRVGFPEPPSDEDIAEGRNMLVIGTQHGNENAPREMALQMLRDLAFTDDTHVLEQLEDATILFIPTANPDGREADTRVNSEGIDINREHLSLRTLEVQTIGEVLNQFNPDITVDGHERPTATGNPDIEMLWPRNLNVDDELQSLNQEMVEDYMFPPVENAGFSTGLYGSPGGSGGGDERIMRNILGLRNGLGVLTETAGEQEPSYRVEAQKRAVESVLTFYRDRFEDVGTMVAGAPERQTTAGADQSDPFYLDGADNWDPTTVLEKKPSGYLLNEAQAEEMRQHIALFSLETEEVDGNGVFAPMSQPMMSILPFLFDVRATYNEVEGLALYDSTNVGTAANMNALVAHFDEEGAFAEASDARALTTHLTTVDHFEKQEEADKAVKHMNGFHTLLEHQKDNDVISEKAYEDLSTYADYLIEKWDVDSDSN
ncbi:carboxypeptidase [Virgibacillus sp. NKC19-3]|uniref:FIMAH domain-containing protein n=1 Tax=Virgibacillus saliphilus TaxID=2831674 RepID=UPI001C9A7624|nr:M14 family zinc carboxypeptidase [Virgibacillus sp. NKC19-3]MBY7144683.1 carboxypeptidase [Virgibacillus sp. NKC19-3]